MLGLIVAVQSAPTGFTMIGFLLIGVAVLIIGGAVVIAARRRAKKSEPAAGHQANVKDMIVWRALAQGGLITAPEAAEHAGLPQAEIEHALLSLVSEGRAAAEPGEEGVIVYRIESPVPGGQ